MFGGDVLQAKWAPDNIDGNVAPQTDRVTFYYF